MKKIILLSLLLTGIAGYAQTLQENLWVAEGSVFAIERVGNTLYVGGQFSGVGPPTPYGAPVDLINDGAITNYVKPNGIVYAVVPDGAGGWYIGGAFTEVGGQVRGHLARINADGSLHSWNPAANDIVRTLTLSGNVVYAGGDFTKIGGLARFRIAAINATTGAINSWDPNANDLVRTIVVDGSTVYVGGDFTNIGGANRNHIAALNASSDDALTGWNPNADNNVHCIAVNGSTVYVGGRFTNIGGLDRSCVAALNIINGKAVSGWQAPTFESDGSFSAVNKIALGGDKLYVGGYFDIIGSYLREGLAALDVGTGAVNAWNPGSTREVSGGRTVTALIVNNDILYVGGEFRVIGGEIREDLAAINTITGELIDWGNTRRVVGKGVYSIGVTEDILYVGGRFSTITTHLRNNLAAFDAITGNITNWNPGATDTIRALVRNENIIYVGGTFTTIGGQNRNNIAAFNVNTGLVTSWNPDANGSLRTLAVDGNTIYAGGAFSQMGGKSRNHIAAINATDGTVTDWDPNLGGLVYSIALKENLLYAGGGFRTAGGQSRNRIAAINTTNGSVTDWNPNIDGLVYSIALKENLLYVGGNFRHIGGQSRKSIAAVDLSSGEATDWNPNPSRGSNTVNVTQVAVSGNTVYAGGGFNQIGGQPRVGVAALDAETGNAILDWNADIRDESRLNWISALYVSDDMVYLGIPDFYRWSTFYRLKGEPRLGLSALSAADNPLPVSFGSIRGVLSGGALLVNFTSLSETNNSHFIVEVSKDGKNFEQIGLLESAAPGGNSDKALDYEWSINTRASGLAGMLGAVLFISLCFFSKRNRKLFAGMALICIFGFVSCKKTTLDLEDAGPDLYIRIVQVDKDGGKSFSQAVKVIID